MKLKTQHILAVLLIAFSFTASAQYYDSSMVKKKEEPKESIWDKMFFGGGLGLQFGSHTVVNISPIVGYRISPKVSAGVGLTYEYFHIVEPAYHYDFETNIWGGSVFGRYYFHKNVFAHGEIEYLNLDAYDYAERRVDVESVLVGGGIMQPFGKSSGITAVALYNLTPSYYTPYPSPLIIRLGVNIGF